MPLQKTKKKKSRAGTGTFYNAQDIRDLFFAETSGRQAQNISNDGGYWTGGMCKWGGDHYLQKDAETLAKFLNKVGELDNAKVELMDCAEHSDFDLTKQKLIAQCDEAINGLKVSTGYGTSVGGICCIWGDFLGFLENVILNKFRREFARLKEEISQTTYDESKELAKLDIEQEKTEQELLENQKKANEETDPSKKAIFLEIVEESKKKLQEITDKKKKIPLNNLGSDFDIKKHIEELIKAAKGNQTPNSDPNNNKKRVPETPRGRTPNSPSPSNPDTSKEQEDWFKQNQQLIIFTGIGLLVIFFLMNQKNDNLYD